MLWFTLRQLKSSNPIKRTRAAEKLAATPGVQAFEHLVAALTDTDFEVRRIIVAGLGRFGDRAVEPLTSALKDKSSSVREAAIMALSAIGGKQIMKPLMSALEDEDNSIRKAAANVLQRIGLPESRQALEEYRRREEEAKLEVRRQAEKISAARLAEEARSPLVQEEISDEVETELKVICGSCSGIFRWSDAFSQSVTKGSPFAPFHMPTSYYHPRVFCPSLQDKKGRQKCRG